MDDAAMTPAWCVLTVVFETVPCSRKNVGKDMEAESPRVYAVAVAIG